jgi:hypothetical protein
MNPEIQRFSQLDIFDLKDTITTFIKNWIHQQKGFKLSVRWYLEDGYRVVWINVSVSGFGIHIAITCILPYFLLKQ